MAGGPLEGIRVLEFAALGAVPFTGMMLADAGADVLRIDRLVPASVDDDLVERGRRQNAVGRSRRSIAIDLKQPAGRDAALELVERADVLLEGFRPGVMERLGLGPSDCFERNSRLVYGRLTGWGQSGPLARSAGHDINYVALSGTLSAIGERDRPTAPLNLLGDFGGGGAMLAFGVSAALLAVVLHGRGCVVDAAMVDGAASLATYIHSMRAAGTWQDEREANVLDGGAPFYRTYRTSDGGFVAVGAVERPFWSALIDGLGLEAELPDRLDRNNWPALCAILAERFATRTRDEWAQVFASTDACVTPVLSMAEAPAHEHLRRRSTFVEVAGVVQPAPTPRFVDFGATQLRAPASPGEGGRTAAREWGCDLEALERLAGAGVLWFVDDENRP